MLKEAITQHARPETSKAKGRGRARQLLAAQVRDHDDCFTKRCPEDLATLLAGNRQTTLIEKFFQICRHAIEHTLLRGRGGISIRRIAGLNGVTQSGSTPQRRILAVTGLGTPWHMLEENHGAT